MLPFSLAVIVLILAVWQDNLLQPKKEELKQALEYYNRLKTEEQHFLPPPSSVKTDNSLIANNSSPNIYSIPKFPR